MSAEIFRDKKEVAPCAFMSCQFHFVLAPWLLMVLANNSAQMSFLDVAYIVGYIYNTLREYSYSYTQTNGYITCPKLTNGPKNPRDHEYARLCR